MKFISSIIPIYLFILLITGCTLKNKALSEEDMSAYLMVYFKDETHSLYMALSPDGYNFTDINNGNPVIDGDTIASQKGIRNPHIMRGPDNKFYMVLTDLHIYAKESGYRDNEWERPGEEYGWGNNRGFVFMKSDDLLNWTHVVIRVDEIPGFEDIGCAWAPQTIYDSEINKLMVYFTMRFGNGHNKLYFVYANDDFSGLESSPQLLFSYPKDVSYTDADIIEVNNKFHMFYTPHDGEIGIKQAVSDHINRGYIYDPEWYDPEPWTCEAPNVWKRIGEDKWVLMYDIYGIQPHNFGFSETTDFINFTNLGRFNEGIMKTTNFSIPKHGAVIHLTKQEAEKLCEYWNLDLIFN